MEESNMRASKCSWKIAIELHTYGPFAILVCYPLISVFESIFYQYRPPIVILHLMVNYYSRMHALGRFCRIVYNTSSAEPHTYKTLVHRHVTCRVSIFANVEMRDMSSVNVFLSAFLLAYIYILYLTYVGDDPVREIIPQGGADEEDALFTSLAITPIQTDTMSS